jgi:hypothetical protein
MDIMSLIPPVLTPTTLKATRDVHTGMAQPFVVDWGRKERARIRGEREAHNNKTPHTHTHKN